MSSSNRSVSSFNLFLFILMTLNFTGCGKQFFDHEVLQQYYRENVLSEFFYRKVGSCSSYNLSFLTLTSAGVLDSADLENIRSLNLSLYFFSDGTYALEYREYNNEELVVQEQLESKWTLNDNSLIFSDLGLSEVTSLNSSKMLPLTFNSKFKEKLNGKTYIFRPTLSKVGFLVDARTACEQEKL